MATTEFFRVPTWEKVVIELTKLGEIYNSKGNNSFEFNKYRVNYLTIMLNVKTAMFCINTKIIL